MYNVCALKLKILEVFSIGPYSKTCLSFETSLISRDSKEFYLLGARSLAALVFTTLSARRALIGLF